MAPSLCSTPWTSAASSRKPPPLRRASRGRRDRGRACARGRIAVQGGADVTQETPSIKASDAERGQAVERLRAHAVDGRLTLEEFAERIDTAYAARTRDELEELNRDLPAPTTAAAPAPKRKATRWLVSVLGGLDRRGRWRLGSDTVAVTFLGGVDL